MLDCLESSPKVVLIPYMPILAPEEKKSGNTSRNSLLGTLWSLNELIHMKLLKIWGKKNRRTVTSTAIPFLPLYFQSLSPPSPSLTLPPSHPLLFSPSALRNAIKLLYGTSFLYNAYCKLAQPWPRYNHQRDAFDRDGVADKLLSTMLNCLLLLRSGKLLFQKTPKFKANMINIQSRQTSVYRQKHQGQLG